MALYLTGYEHIREAIEIECLLLDGSSDGTLKGSRAIVENEIRAAGHDVSIAELVRMNIADCNLCHECWTSTPGECVIKDDAEDLYRKICSTELLVFFTPITFGGFSYQIKKLLDRSTCLFLPVLEKYQGEVRPRPRKDIAQNVMMIGVLRDRDDLAQRCFVQLSENISADIRAKLTVVLMYLCEGEKISQIAVREAMVQMEEGRT